VVLPDVVIVSITQNAESTRTLSDVTEPRKIIIDTDPGIDDAMAIFYALSSPELDVVGMTTIFGNATTETTTYNALALLQLAGRSDIPVARGADAPLVATYGGPVDFVHGADGQGNAGIPASTTSAVAESAAEFIVRMVMAAPGEITLVPVGPLTNIALAMRLEPKLAENLHEIVLMGGNAFCPGNVNPSAEANIHNDPEAADIVFGAACPITMAGLDVTQKVQMTNADLARIAAMDNPRAAHLARILPCYVDFHAKYDRLDGIHVHDSTAISYLLAPDAFTWDEYAVRVDCGQSFGRAKTIAGEGVGDNEKAWAGRTPVRILTGADSRRLVELELSRLAE
jgi:inosine-uridine nucleoside N-ribohydrolase